MAVTEEQIIEAANQIAAGGERPTQHKVRELIGGSYSTIGPVLKLWRQQQEETHELATVAVPDEIAATAQALTGKVWSAAMDVAEERLAAERDALTQVRGELEAEAQEAREAVDQLEAEAEAYRAEIEELKAVQLASQQQIDEQRATISEQAQQWVRKDEQYTAMSIADAEKAKEIKELKALVAAAEKRLVQVQADHKAECSDLDKKISDQQEQIANLKADNAALNTQCEADIAAKNRLEKELEEAKQQAREARDAATTCIHEKGQIGGELKAVKDQLKEKNAALEQMKKQLQELSAPKKQGKTTEK